MFQFWPRFWYVQSLGFLEPTKSLQKLKIMIAVGGKITRTVLGPCSKDRQNIHFGCVAQAS